jgi:hypothetical protein
MNWLGGNHPMMVPLWKSLSSSVIPYHCQCLSIKIAWLCVRFYTPVINGCAWHSRIHKFEGVSTYFVYIVYIWPTDAYQYSQSCEIQIRTKCIYFNWLISLYELWLSKVFACIFLFSLLYTLYIESWSLHTPFQIHSNSVYHISQCLIRVKIMF